MNNLFFGPPFLPFGLIEINRTPLKTSFTEKLPVSNLEQTQTIDYRQRFQSDVLENITDLELLKHINTILKTANRREVVVPNKPLSVTEVFQYFYDIWLRSNIEKQLSLENEQNLKRFKNTNDSLKIQLKKCKESNKLLEEQFIASAKEVVKLKDELNTLNQQFEKLKPYFAKLLNMK